MNKEEVLKDLLDSFDGRNDLHEQYKITLKNILYRFFMDSIVVMALLDEPSSAEQFEKRMQSFIDKWVETNIEKDTDE